MGSTVRIAIDETGKTYPAKVQRLGARVDPVSQSIKVMAAIDGRYAELMSGMSGPRAHQARALSPRPVAPMLAPRTLHLGG